MNATLTNHRALTLLCMLMASIGLLLSSHEARSADPFIVTKDFAPSQNTTNTNHIASAVTDYFDSLLYAHPDIHWSTEHSYTAQTGHQIVLPLNEDHKTELNHWKVDYLLSGQITAEGLSLSLLTPAGSQWSQSYEGSALSTLLPLAGRDLLTALNLPETKVDQALLSRAWFSKPETQSTYGEARHLIRTGQHLDQAHNLFVEAATQSPEVTDAHTYAGWTALWLGDAETARQYFTNALKITPDHFDALWGLITVEGRTPTGKLEQMIAGVPESHKTHSDVLQFSVDRQVDADRAIDLLRKKYPSGGLQGLSLAYKERFHACQALNKACSVAYENIVDLSQTLFGNGSVPYAQAQAELGMLFFDQAQFKKALPLFTESHATIEAAFGKEHPETANLLFELGNTQRELGQIAKAEDTYKRTLNIRQTTLSENDPTIAEVMNNLAELYRVQARYDEAEPLYEQAAAIWLGSYGGAHPDVATVKNNLATLLVDKGHYGRAEDLYQDSLGIRRTLFGQDHFEVGTILNNLAALLDEQGRIEEAAPLYRQSIAITSAYLGEGHPEVATMQNNLATLLERQEQWEEAEQYYTLALNSFRKIYGDKHETVALGLNNLGVLYHVQDRLAEAQSYYEQSLELGLSTLGPDHPRVAAARLNLGVLLLNQSKLEEAKPYFAQAFAASMGDRNPEILWRAAYFTGELLYREKNEVGSIWMQKKAVNTIQSLRQNVSGKKKAHQNLFLKDKKGVYHDLSEKLIDRGRLLEAQNVLSMLKEEEHFSFVRRDASAVDNKKITVNFNETEAAWATDADEMAKIFAQAGLRYRQIKKIEQERDLTSEEEEELDNIFTVLDAAQDQFFTLVEKMNAFNTEEELQVDIARMRLNNATDWQSLLEESEEPAALIHFIPLKDKLILLITTADILISREVNVERRELFRKIHNFRSRVSDPRLDPVATGKDLYSTIFGTIEGDLNTLGVETLLLWLDGPLRYLPFGALHTGDDYLVRKYGLVVMTEASDRGAIARKKRWKLAGFGATKGGQGFSALPAVKEELDGLISPEEGVLKGTAHIDDEFNAGSFRKTVSRGRHPVIHLASHFKFSPGFDNDSFLLLGDGKKLTLKDLGSPKYRMKNVDLLTLSACQTAVGDSVLTGREIEGLGMLAQRQGAKSVIATLWPVADNSTAAFMRLFYKLHEEEGMSKVDAIRKTQLAFVEGSETFQQDEVIARLVRRSSALADMPELEGILDEEFEGNPFTHPFYWAPFILMGDWS